MASEDCSRLTEPDPLFTLIGNSEVASISKLPNLNAFGASIVATSILLLHLGQVQARNAAGA